MLMSDKAMLIGKPQLLANTGKERLPVITAVMISPLSTAFEIALKSFIFSANFSLLAISHKK